MIYKSFFLKATIPFLATAFFLFSGSGVKAEEVKNKNYLGLTTSFINGVTLYGINSKIGISDNISVRPFIELGNVSVDGTNAGVVFYGASASYDFDIPNSGLSPYVGFGVGNASVSVGNASASAGGYYSEIGVDYNASDSIVINANYKVGGSGYLSIGGGYRF
jgi:hypothetical protein